MTIHGFSETNSVRRMLEPNSIAIIGASRDETKRGYQVVESIQELEYGGNVYPVNPKYDDETIRGLRVHESVTDISEPVDLAYVTVPSRLVPEVIEECGHKNVAGAIVVAAGFSEIGNDDLEDRMLAVADEHDVRIIGPNVNGIVNVHRGMDLLADPDIPPGDLALLSQSGNIALALVYEALYSGRAGFSFYISVGNEADVRFHEYLPYLATHEETSAATLFVEGMADGPQFLEEAARFTRKKPIVALKGGLTDAGKQSAQSHTASIAGSGSVIDDVYKQAGVVRVDRADELLSVSSALSAQPPADGPNVGILSDGGGHATHAADSLLGHGLRVPDLEPDTQRRIRNRVPEKAPNVANPVDVLTFASDLDLFYDCADAMLADPNVDALLLCGYFGGYGANERADEGEDEAEVARRLDGLADKHDKPVVSQTMFAELDSAGANSLQESSIPVFESINQATRCLAALSSYGTHLHHADDKSDFVLPEPDPHPLVTDAVSSGRDVLSETEAKRVLTAYDAPVTPFEVATTPEEAVEAATSYDKPVAMKVLSPDIVHKTEVDGVRLDISETETVPELFEEVISNGREHAPDADIEGVIVSPMAEGDTELVIGVTEDEEVGRVIMFGLGGVFVEVLEDVTFRGLPLTEFDARSMLDDVEGSEILDGVRGQEALNREALVDLLLTVSEIACQNPKIVELDLNPVLASPDGVEVVDAAITLDSE